MTRILLVEDDEQVRLLVEEVLMDAGYEVDATSTVAGGRSMLDCRDYDLLLTDGRLPDGNGLSLANKASNQGVAVLVFTGYAHEFPREGREHITVLQKPLRVRELLKHVAASVNA